MAWTINNGKLYFNTKLHSGTDSTTTITGVGFQPDWTWWKSRNNAVNHALYDAVRGGSKLIRSNQTNAEETNTAVSAFTSDGVTLTGGSAFTNASGYTYASWNWLAAGTAPSNTYVVKVVSDTGNKYRFDDFGTSAVTLEISEGGTFTFDQSDSSNNGHPLRFSTTSNGTHGGGSEYTTGVTTNGTPGNAGAYTRITVAASAPTLYYYCSSHSGMGGQANTPVTNSFSNFSGSIQTNISPNTTSGFSIVKYTGNGSNNQTIGHGLGAVPKMIITKPYSTTGQWYTYHASLGNTHYLDLVSTAAAGDDAEMWNDTSPTSSVFTVGVNGNTNGSGKTTIAYCFSDIQGFSKMGSYTGNGNADGSFIYTGFKPAWIMIKRAIGGADNWMIYDNKRIGFNQSNYNMVANSSSVENTGIPIDILSNGFKARASEGNTNVSGNTYIYMAFAENPFTSSAGTPVTAR